MIVELHEVSVGHTDGTDSGAGAADARFHEVHTFETGVVGLHLVVILALMAVGSIASLASRQQDRTADAFVGNIGKRKRIIRTGSAIVNADACTAAIQKEAA